MGNHIRLRLHAVEDLRAALAGLPPQHPEEVSRREAVKLLAPEIEALLSRGYNIADIARILSTRGLDLSAVVLKSYLSAARRPESRKTKQPRVGGTRRTVEASSRPAAERSGSRQVVSTKPAQASPSGAAVNPVEAPARSLEQQIGEQSGDLEPRTPASISTLGAARSPAPRKSLFSVADDTQDI